MTTQPKVTGDEVTSRLIRVFPRRTKASPDDALAYFGRPDLFAEADEVHVSVTFTADKAIAEGLAEDWRYVAPVKIGGVAYGDSSLEFIPGRYIKPGAAPSLRAVALASAGSAACGRSGPSPMSSRSTRAGTSSMTTFWPVRARMSRPCSTCSASKSGAWSSLEG